MTWHGSLFHGGGPIVVSFSPEHSQTFLKLFLLSAVRVIALSLARFETSRVGVPSSKCSVQTKLIEFGKNGWQD